MSKKINYVTPEVLDKITHAINIDVYSLKKVSIGTLDISGVYMLWNNEQLVYIGKSKSVFNRIISHIRDINKQITHFSYIELAYEDADLYERMMINKYRPTLNKDSILKKINNDEANILYNLPPF